MQYKIPSRLEIPDLQVEFESSYEPTGPFGAKSIGEVVINTPGACHCPGGLSRYRPLVQGTSHYPGEDYQRTGKLK